MAHVSVHPLWSSLAPDRTAGVSLQDQIVSFFRDAIVAGRLQRGRRVPSSRTLAIEHGISRTTAVEAYERLVSEGYLVSSRGAGVFVAHALPEDLQHEAVAPPTAPAFVTPGPHTPAPSPPDMRSFQLPLAPWIPAIDRFPWAEWAKLTNQICREQPLNAISYGDPQGEPPLREAIAEYLGAARGILCRPEQIVVTSGTEMTLRFAAERVAARGSTVWIEEPIYTFVHRLMPALGFKSALVPVDGAGLDVAEGVRRAPHARVVLVAPSHQYPLGVTMDMTRRTALVEWAHESGAWILENEIDADYRYVSRPLTPLYSLARSPRVIYCGSLSKPLAPGLRVNYLLVPESLVGRCKQSATLTPMLTQLVLARFSATGRMASHMRKMRVLHAKRRALLFDALRSECAGLLDVDNLPEAGLSVKVPLLVPLRDTRIAAECLVAGIKVEPLSVCYAGSAAKAGLILGFASTPEAQILPSVRTLAGILRCALETPGAH
jgi:GntR family transcriptional regulator / MocR family aminotransferase